MVNEFVGIGLTVLMFWAAMGLIGFCDRVVEENVKDGRK